jgi:hypothetical protein
MSLFDSASIVITPNGVKEGKLYSIKPSDGSGDLSVTRATTATRVNSAGLIELVPYNLVTYSEQFNNAAWILGNNVGAATITANNATAPNGTLTADKIVFPSVGSPSQWSLVFQPFTSIASAYNGSFYIKGELGTEIVWISFTKDGVNYQRQICNLTTEWQRFNISATLTAGADNFQIGVDTRDSSQTARPSQTIYLWGGQLVEGSSAKDYLKTETRLNIPRLDYTNGSCPSILVEPQRTNISAYVENGTGNFNSATVVSAPNILGLTAFKVTTDLPPYTDVPFINTNSQFQANTPYTISVYTDFSKCTGSSITLSFLGLFTVVSFTGITVDKTTKAITSSTTGTNWTINSYSATQINGEIYRIILTATPNATATAISRNYIFTDNTFSIEVSGVQVEQGTYPTSFISKPSGSSVTRNADVISKTGISDLIGQTEGSAFVDVNLNLSFTEEDMRFITISDGSSSNWYFIGTNTTNEIRFYFRAGATTYVSELVTLTSGRHKLAFAYKNNDYVAYVDGVQIYSTSSLSVGSTTSFDLGKSFGSSGVSKQFINSATLWKERLTNEQLAQLTTL